MQITQSRRHFLTTLSVARAAGVLGARRSLADEGPPEVKYPVATKRVLRALLKAVDLCVS